MTDKESGLTLTDTVIGGGYCIGCGVCAAATNSGYQIVENQNGFFVASKASDLPHGAENIAVEVCPHSGVGKQEDELAAARFAGTCEHNAGIGYFQHLSSFALTNESDRLAGSSGGGVTWLLRELLDRDLVDHVAHVKPSADTSDELFTYGISSSASELQKGRKSTYYPVELSKILAEIRENDGRYAITAIPCFAKAIRKICELDPLLNERIKLVVGLVCGHLKSKHFAEYLGWSAGVAPDSLVGIDFRKKLEFGSAGDYAISATELAGTKTSARMADYFGTTWDLGFLKYNACDYCDDVFAETADVVFGDAWIAPYSKDWRGHNIVISRNSTITGIISDAIASPDFELEELTVDDIVQSQAGGLRHRREGLSYRLSVKDKLGLWRPRKRVASNAQIQQARMRIYLMRAAIAAKSADAFLKAKRLKSLLVFKILMTMPVFRYYMFVGNIILALKNSFMYKDIIRPVKRLIRKNHVS